MNASMLLGCIAVCLGSPAFAQPDPSIYSESQRRQAREKTEMNRHYEEIKPRKSTSSNAPLSGEYNAYQMADYSHMKSIQAAEERQRVAAAKFSEKEKKLAQIIADNGLQKSKLYYPLVLDAVRMAGLDTYWGTRVFGSDATLFESYAAQPSYAMHHYFPVERAKPMAPAAIEVAPTESPKTAEQAATLPGASTPAAKNLGNTLQALNQYLVTFDQGYINRIEVQNGEFLLYYRNGQHNKANMNDLAQAVVEAKYSRVILTCQGDKKCIYSSWYGGGYYPYLQFTSNSPFNQERLAELLNNVLAAYKQR